jgi:hypothetical protein
VESSKIDRLRARRIEAAALAELASLRMKFGPSLVAQINESAGVHLSLADFVEREIPRGLDWPVDIRNASGLVAAYVDRGRARRVIECISASLGRVNGLLGFHDKDYLGTARLEDFSVIGMLDIAASTEDSVLFYSNDRNFVLLVDCYGADAASQFSVVLQGEQLAGCEVCFG